MADETGSRVDDAAVQELFTDEDGIVGRYIRELAEQVADEARILAPKDTGHLAGSIRVVVNHGDTGKIQGLVGAGAHAKVPLSHPGWQAGYPYALALDNRQGFTFNRHRKGAPKGSSGARRLHRFLTRALESLEGR